MIAGALAFLLFVALATYTGRIPLFVLLSYLGVSAVTFLVYWFDKSAARADAQRVPEIRLHLLALAGGWPGAMLAQQLLRHKSSKTSFRAVFWITVVVNCSVLAWLFTEHGAATLQFLLGQLPGYIG